MKRFGKYSSSIPIFRVSSYQRETYHFLLFTLQEKNLSLFLILWLSEYYVGNQSLYVKFHLSEEKISNTLFLLLYKRKFCHYFTSVTYSGCPNKREGTGVLKESESEKNYKSSSRSENQEKFWGGTLFYFLYENLPTSFWVIIHPQEVKIRCNCEEALRKSSSTSENQVQFLRRHKKIYFAK